MQADYYLPLSKRLRMSALSEKRGTSQMCISLRTVDENAQGKGGP